MPVVVLLYQLQAEEEEDDAVTHAGHGLYGILDGCVALLAQVLEGVPLDSDPVRDDADDARPVEEFGQEEGEVSRGEDDERLDDPDMSGEPGDETGEQTVE